MRKENGASKRTLVIMAIGAAAALVAAAMVGRSVLHNTAGLITIDFDDVVTTAGTAVVGVEHRQPVLRMAVAAKQSPKKTHQQYYDLLRLVANRMERRALLAQRKTYAEINDMVERKEVDVAFICTAPYVIGKAKFEMEILVVPVTQGQKVYYSYTLAHRNSSVSSFDDLRGKVFAFTDPQSNTGCLVPTYVLLQWGETPRSFFSEYYYTYSHDNSIEAVAEGMADGAAVDSLVWEYLQETDPVYTSRTKIIEKSPPYGIPPVVVHPDLNRDLKDRLRRVFLSLHEDEQARDILRALRIDRFEKGDDAAYESVRKMWRLVSQGDGQKP